MLNQENFHCRICGLIQSYLPWREYGKTPSFKIYSCCGAEFGHQDATIYAIQRYRQKWISESAKWFKSEEKTELWSLEKQLKEITNTFL